MHKGVVKRVLVTGGGSRNKGMCQIISNVFDCPVFVQEAGGGASYGAAMRALWAIEKQSKGKGSKTWSAICGAAIERGWKKVCSADVVSAASYKMQRSSYELFEDKVVTEASEKAILEKEMSEKDSFWRGKLEIGLGAAAASVGIGIGLLIFNAIVARKKGSTK